MRAWLGWLALVATMTACSFKFDPTTPELPLVGDEPNTPSLPHLNSMPVTSERYLTGIDGKSWLVIQQTDNSYRLVDLTGSLPVDTVMPEDYDNIYPHGRELYLIKSNPADMGQPDGGFAGFPPVGDLGAPPTATVTVRSPGEHPGQQYLEPGGAALLYPNSHDSAFAYMVQSKSAVGYILQRRDSDFRRIVPWPKGVNPTNPYKLPTANYFWDAGAGVTFYDTDADGRLVAHSAVDNSDIDLGIRPRFLGWVDTDLLVTCGDDGVRLVPTDGVTPETILDPGLCDPDFAWLNGDYFYYYGPGQVVQKVRFDGTSAPEPVYDFGDKRLLLIINPFDTVIYSTDPAMRYIGQAGDGWLVPRDGGPDFKFMERGTGLSYYDNLTQLYWLESSAQETGAGELMSLKLPGPGLAGGTKVPLARNVRFYNRLGDGRILCDDDHAFNGTQNRIVVLDELRHHAQWVASSSNYISPVPGGDNDYVVEVVSGDRNSYDLVRVSLPPIEPTPPPNQ